MKKSAKPSNQIDLFIENIIFDDANLRFYFDHIIIYYLLYYIHQYEIV